MTEISFHKEPRETRIADPRKGFEETVLPIEYRIDPLTGHDCTVVRGRAQFVRGRFVTDEAALTALREGTRKDCPFCPENLAAKATKFPEAFWKGGRITAGEAVAFPNILPHAERNVVTVLSSRHFLRLDEFMPRLLTDAFRCGTAYLRRLHEVEPAIRYPVFAFNYLPPAGATLFHPHMQVFARTMPFYLPRILFESGETYYRKNATPYWEDLVAAERGGDRYLFGREGVDWLVPFAPMSVSNEVQGIVRSRSDLLEVTDAEWDRIAEGFSRILGFFHSEGRTSFTATLVGGPMGETLPHFRIHLRVLARPGVQAMSFTDAWSLPLMLWDGECGEEPEAFAGRIRAFLGTPNGTIPARPGTP